MIEITAKRNRNGLFALTATGHAGWGEHGGDIVCAAISTLMQALAVGLQDVLALEGVREDSDPGVPSISLVWSGGGERAECIARTVYLSLQGVAASYPEYVTVRELYEEDDIR